MQKCLCQLRAGNAMHNRLSFALRALRALRPTHDSDVDSLVAAAAPTRRRRNAHSCSTGLAAVHSCTLLTAYSSRRPISKSLDGPCNVRLLCGQPAGTRCASGCGTRYIPALLALALLSPLPPSHLQRWRCSRNTSLPISRADSPVPVRSLTRWAALSTIHHPPHALRHLCTPALYLLEAYAADTMPLAQLLSPPAPSSQTPY
jgi:hypothetical protein